MTSDRPTPIGEFHYRDTIEAPPPGYDIDAPGEDTDRVGCVLPGDMIVPATSNSASGR
jgi:hypothetical protein